MAGTDKAKGHGLSPREEDTGVGWGLACRFISEDSCGQWGQCRGEGKAAGGGRGRNWLQCNPKETLSVDPKEASEARITLQSCFKLRQKDHSFIPTLNSHWMWAAPGRARGYGRGMCDLE